MRRAGDDNTLSAVEENATVPIPFPFREREASGVGNMPLEATSPHPTVTMTPKEMTRHRSSDSVPQVKNGGQKSSSRHPKPPIRESMGTDNLLDMNWRDVVQSWRQNQPDNVQSLAMEDGTVPLNNSSQKAWWLDVASPTSEDMRMLGMVRHSGGL